MRGLVGRNGAGKTTAMRIVLGLVEPDGGNGAVEGRADRRRRPPPHRLHARGAGPLPEDEGARPARLLRGPVGHGPRRRPGVGPEVGGPARRGRTGRRQGRGPLPRQPAAGAAVRRPRPRARRPRARRAVLRPRPRRRRRPGRRPEGGGAAGRGRRLLQPPARTGGRAVRRRHHPGQGHRRGQRRDRGAAGPQGGAAAAGRAGGRRHRLGRRSARREIGQAGRPRRRPRPGRRRRHPGRPRRGKGGRPATGLRAPVPRLSELFREVVQA